MNLRYQKVLTALALFGLLFSSVSSAAYAGISCTISGNGSDTDNECEVEVKDDVAVLQVNEAEINNNVTVTADTGDNEAEDNTGGDVDIETGDADVTVSVSNTANSNEATVATNSSMDFEGTISGNGTDTDNEIDMEYENEVDLTQCNDADIENEIGVEADTGDNEAGDNTGGDVSIDTGSTTTNVSVSNTANANVATVGSGNDGGSVSACIADNGSDSDNEIEIEVADSTAVLQQNSADIENDINVEANTGGNEAEDNTGGDVEIETGDADFTVMVDTMANFNAADILSGIVGDIELGICDNGTDSENEIEVEIGDTGCCPFKKDDSGLNLTQSNHGMFDNGVCVFADTGDNEVEDNTCGGGGCFDTCGCDDGDCEYGVSTGNQSATVGVSTTANQNIFGGFDWGDLFDDWDWCWNWGDVDCGMNFSAVWMAFRAMMG